MSSVVYSLPQLSKFSQTDMALSAKCVSRMADALKEEIIEHIYMSEKYNEVMHELVSEALQQQLGEIDEDLFFELGMCIVDRLHLK
jgi:protoheme ferro-lyase